MAIRKQDITLLKPQPPSEQGPRWQVGIDKKMVGAYVAVALLAGFGFGILAGRGLWASSKAPERLARSEKPADSPAPTGTPISNATAVSPTEFHRVSRVIHGDVIEIDGVGTVRALGIETPDEKLSAPASSPQASSAIAYAGQTLSGKEVRVELDPSTTSRGGKDDAGLLTGYVYMRDGSLFNAEMIKQGLAVVKTGEQFQLIDQFRALEREAMQNMRGIWGPGTDTSIARTSIPDDHGSSSPPGERKKMVPLLPSDLDARSPAPMSSASDPLVFVSGSDHSFHKDGCEFLGKKKHALLLSQARTSGYTACSRCFASTVLKAQ